MQIALYKFHLLNKIIHRNRRELDIERVHIVAFFVEVVC